MATPYVSSALIYTLPRVLGYLTTQPPPSALGHITTQPPNTIDRINSVRQTAFDWSQILITAMGEKNWNLLMDLTVDNAWIADIVISILLHNNTSLAGIKKGLFVGLNYLAIGSCVWLARFGAHRGLQAMNITDITVFKTRD